MILPPFPNQGLAGPWFVLDFTAKGRSEQADSSEGLRSEACSHTQSQSYQWDARASRCFLRLLRGVRAGQRIAIAALAAQGAPLGGRLAAPASTCKRSSPRR